MDEYIFCLLGTEMGAKTWKHLLMVESMSIMLTIICLDIQLRIHREQMGVTKTDWQIMSLYVMGRSLNVGDEECAKGKAESMCEDRHGDGRREAPRHQRRGVQRGQNCEHMGGKGVEQFRKKRTMKGMEWLWGSY